ncbi:restriction endonuclease (plasmid) [Rhodococcus pyridinivorans]|uniref:restriction endonuclease n=1 Tax=Rhodococcus pyridinivorans TaxID=103816 RepID=UPI001C30974C|nr:restriction endonuclease [Rhodococcus pyridinivorans]QXF84298.1 restriction endonuclease [Rhodococcus pyridinivorans]
MSSEDAEFFAAARMRDMGFSDARVTGRGADGGIDVVSRRAIAQVKWKHSEVTRPDLQRLYGARGADHSKYMLFFAELSDMPYTQPAIEYANKHRIGLFAYTTDRTLFPLNQHARDFWAGIDEVQAARAAKQVDKARSMTILWGAFGVLLVGSLVAAIVAVFAAPSAVDGWLALSALGGVGMVASWDNRPRFD